MKYVIRVGSSSTRHCWVADWDGDPGRTLIKASAKVYPDKAAAAADTARLREKYPNRAFYYEPKGYNAINDLMEKGRRPPQSQSGPGLYVRGDEEPPD